MTYVWSPQAGLFTNSTATTAYTGQNLATVYAAPTVQTTYTVTATDVATGCVSTASVLVNYTPPAPTVTPNPVTMCLGDPAVKLKASSSTTSTVAFNSGTIAVAIPDNNQAGASHNIAVSGIPANATITGMRVKMTIPHTFIGDLVIALRAPNNNVLNLDFFLSNTFGGVTTGFSNTIFTSAAGAPAVSTGTNPYSSSFRADGQIAATGNGPAAPTGYTANMANFAALISSLTSANVNGNYTLAMYDGGAIDIGTLTNWEIEFTYVQGVVASPAVWSPALGLFSDAAATVPYVAGTPVDSVWTRPNPSGVYTYQVTVNNVISSGGQVPLPPHVSAFTGNVRGYWFTAPSAFTMTSVQVPTEASTGTQNIAVVRFNGATPPPVFPGTTNAFTTLFLTQNNPAAGAIPVNIQVNAGDVIGMLGVRNNVNSYSATAPNTTVINGTTVNLIRMGMQFPLATTAPQQLWQEPAGAISRVFFSTAMSVTGTCQSPARTVVVTVTGYNHPECTITG